MKTITILGSTGVQGTSVVDAFLNQTDWSIRAVTRNPSSDRARLLQQKSSRIELIQADTGDFVSLTSAFQGATAIFAVTDYWAPFSNPTLQKEHATGPDPGDSLRKWAYEDEVRHGKNIADAAAQVGDSLKHFIWSSLPSCKEYSRGKYSHIYHFDSKAVVTRYIKENQPRLAEKMSVILIAFYASNMYTSSMMHPVKQSDGSFLVERLSPENAKLPFIITSQDTGPFVKALIDTNPGKTLLAYTAMLSWGEMAQIWGKALNKRVSYREAKVDEFKKRFPLAGEELLSAKYCAEFGYAGHDPDVMEPKDLGFEERAEEIEEWFKKQDWTAVLDAQSVDE